MVNLRNVVDRSKRTRPYPDLGLTPAGVVSTEAEDLSRRNMLLGLGRTARQGMKVRGARSSHSVGPKVKLLIGTKS